MLSQATSAKITPLISNEQGAATVQSYVMDSLVNRDPQMARQVCLRDDEADDLNDQIIRELINYMLEDQANIKRALDIIQVSRDLERIADHATNVAEVVIYMVEGKDIRHSRGR